MSEQHERTGRSGRNGNPISGKRGGAHPGSPRLPECVRGKGEWRPPRLVIALTVVHTRNLPADRGKHRPAEPEKDVGRL
jgi:hypothetical protein